MRTKGGANLEDIVDELAGTRTTALWKSEAWQLRIKMLRRCVDSSQTARISAFV